MNDPAFFFRAHQLGYATIERKDIPVYIDEDGECDVERDSTVNRILFENKKIGNLNWSTDFLRFNWERLL